MRRILLSCTAAAVAALSSAAPARAQSVPIGGSFTGSIVSMGTGRCGPTRVTVDVSLAGLLSPFGAVTGTQSTCFNAGSFNAFDGLFTLNFVGGSTLFGTQLGTFTPTGPQQFMGTSTFTITGGTGIFTGASGSGTTSGTQNLGTGAVAFQASGTVSAPGLVPEPSTFALLGGGLAGVAAISRVRRRRRAE
jgi:PEP-CTERM motif